jgi:hypothetical protein
VHQLSLRVDDQIAFISLSRGLEAIIDVADVDVVTRFSWHAVPSTTGQFYVRNQYQLYLHRLITNCPEDKEVDHINRNPLDNRRSNLRVCDHKTNMENGRFALTTHCPRGHEYNEANTYINKKGKRICRACNALRVSAIYADETPEQREERRQRVSESHAAHRDERLAKMREYVLAHKEEKRRYDAARRARLKNAAAED